jgi:hypothetical protein
MHREIKRLRDEVNRLKGEQGTPKIKGNTPKPAAEDYSSEKDRKKVFQRDVSLGPRTQARRRAWNTFATLAETSKKLDVTFYQYIARSSWFCYREEQLLVKMKDCSL